MTQFDPPCSSCRWYGGDRCGAFDMPAELARSRPMLCGITGTDHEPRPSETLAFVESWWFIALVMVAAGTVGFFHYILPSL